MKLQHQKRVGTILYCAWILWQTAIPVQQGTSMVHDIMSANDTLAACQADQKVAYARITEDMKAEQRSVGLEIYYRCLPDTIDPRGVKGGK